MSRATVDGNEAAVSVAYRLNEVCAIYPITPASPMAELADTWSAAGRRNIFGSVPTVVEMQSEGGAAGTLHGALQAGARATTFTASQGLLLMIPDMFKIAGELTPTVIHVAARSIAAQGLSIFGDHQDVMAVRQTGFALLASSSVQEAHDLALVAEAATLRSRVPFVHFFDGFRTSHELNTIELLADDVLARLVPRQLVWQHRRRGLSPEHPVLRGTSQNPDVYFQARETVNRYYEKVPGIVAGVFEELAELTGRSYRLAEYTGHPEADRVVVAMGSSTETLRRTVERLVESGERVGVVALRLYRPFPVADLLAALPPSAKAIGVLDRTKEPGSYGEPLLLDVLSALADQTARSGGELPLVSGGRYGLSSKEFTPAMAAGVFSELAKGRPRRGFTVGIEDDVTFTSISCPAAFDIEPRSTRRAVFFGIGSDGTVGASKNAIKILGQHGLFAQGYFVYDSKKSGSETVSHLRFGPEPIEAPYLVEEADFVGCHHLSLVERSEVLARAGKGATLLLNSPYGPEQTWQALSSRVQAAVIDKDISLHVIDADGIARELGLDGRVNTVLQACFFRLAEPISIADAEAAMRAAVEKSYGRRGRAVVEANLAAIDRAARELKRLAVPEEPSADGRGRAELPEWAPPFVKQVTAVMMAGEGDALPVSALPADGTWPTGTARFEKRSISATVASWDPQLCIQCGNCSFVCPHSVLRGKYFKETLTDGAPDGFKSAPLVGRGLPGTDFAIVVYEEDCTGCGLCVEACPVTDPEDAGRRAINLEPARPREESRAAVSFFEELPTPERRLVDFGTVRGAQFLTPLFEFSGACAGCGETPYLKLLSQLFGDRAVIANATGCSSIYGGNLPTTPWTKDEAGRGPAWSNSLFEDNAEFGLGFRLAADVHREVAEGRLRSMAGLLGADLVEEALTAPQRTESEIARQRERLASISSLLSQMEGEDAADLTSVLEHLLRRSIWIVGGDGWAYDIGAGGLDHVLSSGRDVNVLVLDTEVYSNTGGQMSKATPLGAVAKFAAAGKVAEKKDLGLQAISYGSVYVARVAMGADPAQTLRAFREAEAFAGPSLVIAYSHCIAHGYDMRQGLDQQRRAVLSGYWPLFRYDPVLRERGENPFLLDSTRPRLPLSRYAGRELRYSALARSEPEEAERLFGLAEEAVRQRWTVYEEMAGRPAHRFPADARRRPA